MANLSFIHGLIYEIHQSPASYSQLKANIWRHYQLNYLVLNFLSMNLSIIKPFLFILIFCGLLKISAHSQNPMKYYETAWKKVEDFTKKGLPKSALEEVKKIYIQAKIPGYLPCFHFASRSYIPML